MTINSNCQFVLTTSTSLPITCNIMPILVILLMNKLENTWAMIDWRTNFRREFIFYIICIFFSLVDRQLFISFFSLCRKIQRLLTEDTKTCEDFQQWLENNQEFSRHWTLRRPNGTILRQFWLLEWARLADSMCQPQIEFLNFGRLIYGFKVVYIRTKLWMSQIHELYP